jgi:hypothetical protein
MIELHWLRRAITNGSVVMKTELDFTAAWNDAMSMLSAHREIVVAIAGVFVFLPQLVFGYMFPQPEFDAQNSEKVLAQLIEWYGVIAPWVFLMGVISGIGLLAVNFIALNHTRPAAGDAIVFGAKHYLTLFVASILSMIAITIGLFLLIIPGVYLYVKFSQVRTVIAAENEFNPITALSRSWQVTKGNSLRIFGFTLIIAIVAGIAMLIVNLVFGNGAKAILPGSSGLFVFAMVSAFTTAIVTILMEFVNCGIYRQLVSDN